MNKKEWEETEIAKNFLPCTIYQSGCPLTGREGQKNVVESNGILRFFCTFRILSYLLYLQYIYRYSYRRAASLALQTLKEKWCLLLDIYCTTEKQVTFGHLEEQITYPRIVAEKTHSIVGQDCQVMTMGVYTLYYQMDERMVR